MSDHQTILDQVGRYYTDKVETHGATHKGVDWNSSESQELRFAQLTHVIADGQTPFSLLDYGCGYGALLPYLENRWQNVTYTGFDISAAMLTEAARLAGNNPNVHFVQHEDALPQANYVVASGIFNVRLESTEEVWQQYVLATVNRMWAKCEIGIAFNALTSYSDADYMRADLHYADPNFWFDTAKRHFSRHVALLHDYGLYEFTLIVRKVARG